MKALPIVFLAAACASSPRLPPRPLGVDQNLDEARRHEDEAARHDRIASETATTGATYACGDVVMAEQPHTGNDPVVILTPCWQNEAAVIERHRDEAERLRADARAHRARAHELRSVEATSCATMPASELTHTPFAHHEDIAAITAETDGDEVRGARIRFRPVEGLTADWLRTALACHHARAAVIGYDPDYLSYDPSVLAGAVTEVVDDPDGITVVIHAQDDATALVIYGRAEDLIDGDR